MSRCTWSRFPIALACGRATERKMNGRLERIEAEMAAKNPYYRGLGYWIARVKAESEAENAA